MLFSRSSVLGKALRVPSAGASLLLVESFALSLAELSLSEEPSLSFTVSSGEGSGGSEI